MVQTSGGVLLPQADGIQLLLIQALQASGGSPGQGTESKSVHPNCFPNHPSKQRKIQCESATDCICMLSK